VTLKQALSRAREILLANEIEDASLNSELLLRHTLNISRAQLYLDLECELSPKQEKNFWNLMKCCLDHEPTAYITGHCEFYGLDFCVDPSVLIPRPESELLVEKALSLARDYSLSTIAEIGTGCGAIAISLALNLPQTKIYATDVSSAALRVTLTNSQKYGLASRIHLLQGNMLEPLPKPVDLIIANLPYIKKTELPSTDPAKSEPLLALNGGPDGLQKIRQLCQQVSSQPHPPGYLLLEIGLGQSQAMTSLLRNLFPYAKIEIAPDLSGIDRLVSLHLNNKKG
jgi:release factor glutamine methyltransferase